MVDKEQYQHYQDQLDTRAIELAREALVRIEMNEKRVEDQLLGITTQLGSIGRNVNRLFDRFWFAALAIIGILLTVAGVYVKNTLDKVENSSGPVYQHQQEQPRK